MQTIKMYKVVSAGAFPLGIHLNWHLKLSLQFYFAFIFWSLHAHDLDLNLLRIWYCQATSVVMQCAAQAIKLEEQSFSFLYIYFFLTMMENYKEILYCCPCKKLPFPCRGEWRWLCYLYISPISYLLLLFFLFLLIPRTEVHSSIFISFVHIHFFIGVVA